MEGYLKLKRVESKGMPLAPQQEAIYETTHQSGTLILKTTLKLVIDPKEVLISVDFGECKAESPDLAFDKLADWMERTAKAIRSRGVPKSAIPIH